MSDAESFADQIARLELMADGDPTWDLSDNDRAAIRALLENYRECIGAAMRDSAESLRKFCRRPS
jgi:hypothetical protein